MATKAKPLSVKTDPCMSGYPSQLPRVVIGTGREVSSFLRQTPTRRTVAITFENENELAAAEEVYRRVGEVLPQLIRSRQQEKLNKVIEGLSESGRNLLPLGRGGLSNVRPSAFAGLEEASIASCEDGSQPLHKAFSHR